MRYLDTALDAEQPLSSTLVAELADADLVAIRTGFSSLRGIELVLGSLRAVLARGGRVEIVLGGADEQPEIAGLLVLAELAEDHANASVRIVTDGEVFQNAKTYYVRGRGGRSCAWVGSANLTLSGFTANDEAVLMLDAEDSEELKNAVLRGIRAYATGRGSQPLTMDVVVDIREAQAFRFDGGAPADNGSVIAVPFTDTLEPFLEEIDATASAATVNKTPEGVIKTGFEDLDLVTQGLRSGQLVVIASRPQVGKSTLLLDLARSAAIKQQIPSLFFTLEATQREVSARVLSAEARIRIGDMQAGTMSDQDWMRLARRMTEVAGAALLISSRSTVRITKLCSDIASLVNSHGVRAIFIDSLNAITGTYEAASNREREVSAVVRKLKTLALQLDICVVVTAELARTVQARIDQRPMVEDLRESDTIAQVADLVILINRPDSFERDNPRAGEADLILAKHRNGPTCTVEVAHQLHYSRFTDLAKP